MCQTGYSSSSSCSILVCCVLAAARCRIDLFFMLVLTCVVKMCLQSLSCVLLSKLQIAKPAARVGDLLIVRGSRYCSISMLGLCIYYNLPLVKEGWKLEIRQSTVVSKGGLHTKFISEQQFQDFSQPFDICTLSCVLLKIFSANCISSGVLFVTLLSWDSLWVSRCPRPTTFIHSKPTTEKGRSSSCFSLDRHLWAARHLYSLSKVLEYQSSTRSLSLPTAHYVRAHRLQR